MVHQIRRSLLGGALSAAVLLAMAMAPNTAGAVETRQATGTVHYVNCSATENGDGSEAKPLNSITAANGVSLQAGDQLLFKRGTTCESQVQTVDGQSNVKAGLRVVNAKGTADAPIIIGAYGDVNNGAPIIAGNGVSETVLLKNSEYITVSGLEVTNKDVEGQSDKYMRRGIVVMNDNAGVLHNITVADNNVHDVRGEFAKDLGGSGGIQLETYGRAVPVAGSDKTKSSVKYDSNRAGMRQSYFDGVNITGNTVNNATRSGINMSTDWRCREDVRYDCGVGAGEFDKFPWVPNRNVLISGNTVEHIGGDGIVVQMSDGAVVEKNYVNDAANKEVSGQNNAAVWNWNSDNTLFQYNEVSNTGRKSNNDGTAWDFDYGTRNTIYQYNYSHDNAGGALLVCGCASWMTQWGSDSTKAYKSTGYAEGAVFRYNVSINDGVSAAADGDSNRLMFVAGVTDMSFYNNTIVLPKELAVGGQYAGDGKSYQLTTNGDNGSIAFVNNLIISPVAIADENNSLDSGTRHMVYGNNLYVGSDGAGSNWAQVGVNGNKHVALNDYVSATGLNLDKVYAGDLSTLANISVDAKSTGRAFAPKQASFNINNTALADDAMAAKSFPSVFDVKSGKFDGQVSVPSFSKPDIGAYQSTASNEGDKVTVSKLKAGSSTVVDVPGNATIKVSANASENAHLSVSIDNKRDYVQQAEIAEGKGMQHAFVRTSSDSSAIKLENTGTADLSGITLTTVYDLIWDGSFESHAAKDDTDNGISPWSDASYDDTANYDSSSWRKTVKQRSDKNQKDAVVSGEYAGRLSNKTTDAWNHARLNQRNIPAVPGVTYRIGVWGTLTGSSNGDNPTLQVRVKSRTAGSGSGGAFSQYSDVLLDKTQATVSKGGGKIYVSGTFTVPTNAEPSGALWVSVAQTNLAEGGTSYVDNVTVVEEPTDEAIAEINKDALNAEIGEADKLTKSDYTADSWTAYQSALDKARKVAADDTVTQSEVDAAAAALKAAREGLVKSNDIGGQGGQNQGGAGGNQSGDGQSANSSGSQSGSNKSNDGKPDWKTGTVVKTGSAVAMIAGVALALAIGAIAVFVVRRRES